MSDCIRCKYQPATICGECVPCNYVSIVLVTVHGIWPHTKRFDSDKQTELEELHERLASGTLKEFRDKAKQQGAFLSSRLAWTIEAMAYPAKIDPEDMRQRVCKAIKEYIHEIDGIRKYEAQPGNAGAYMKYWKQAIADLLAKTFQLARKP